jgi:hypothetical protein
MVSRLFSYVVEKAKILIIFTVYVNSGKTLLHDTVNLNNQLLVFKITLPKNSKPLIG